MSERRKFICGNWKMNGTASEAASLTAGIVGLWKDAYRNVELAVCPPFTALLEVHSLLSGRGVQIALGAQNCYHETKGAYTGEISPRMLVEANCTYVILGHSERRTIFNEDDQLINKKVRAALSVGLKPILCIGETLDERELNQTYEVLLRQLREGLRDIAASDMKSVTIAYEPVWAIGTGRTATPQMAQDAHSFIRMEIAKLYDDSIAGGIIIQYGGSMKPDNAKELLAQPDIDGGLIGGAALDAKQFLAIADAALN
jgi:triosephosphate isomerase (TIM)